MDVRLTDTELGNAADFGDLMLECLRLFQENADILADYQQRFRYILPQTFLMGSPENETGRRDNEAQHEVTLTQGYWLADTTITQSFWEAITGDNPSNFKGKKRPVEQVSWNDTRVFIEKLKQQWPLLEIRLPREAEWECACRAGITTPFSFGGKDDLNVDNVNYSGKWDNWSSDGETKEVKSLPANPSGLYEMHGNVFEWCQDWFGEYPKESVTDPQGANHKSGRRVVRGGSWNLFGWLCRSACRFGHPPVSRRSDVGFRLALGHLSSGQEQAGSTPDKERRGAKQADEQVGSQTASQENGSWSKFLGLFKRK